MVDGAVVVIGAMLIAPLMKPILVLAFGLVVEDHVFVYVELGAPDAFTRAQLQTLRARIAARIERPVNLELQLVLTRQIELYPYASELPLHGAEKPVPRG